VEKTESSANTKSPEPAEIQGEESPAKTFTPPTAEGE
jgi:hypothetical protein